MNGVDRTFSAAVPARHRNEMVQECVRRVCGFEPRRRPKIVGCRIDRLATCQCLDHIRRAVTQAERPHRNECAVVGPQRGAKVQFENPIRSKKEPVGASAGKHRSPKARALKVAARDGDRPPSSMGHGADAFGVVTVTRRVMSKLVFITRSLHEGH
jgi:hypothetical protein